MPAAVLATAFVLLGLTVATADSPQHALPAGTAVVFLADGPLNASARAGSGVDVHLRDPLVLDGVTLAAAGAKARVRTTGGTTEPGGRRTFAIVLEHFVITGGTMPVAPVEPVVSGIEPGTAIGAKTQAVVERLGDRYSIRIPFPFPLSADRPASYYTPTPARTASPNSLLPRTRRPSPTPSPAPTATLPADAAPAAASPAATMIP